MHIVLFKRRIRERKEILSAEVRFVLKKFIRERDPEKEFVDSIELLHASLSRAQDYTWVRRRIESTGLTLGALKDGFGVCVPPASSECATRRFFELIDELACRKVGGRRFVTVDDLVLASLASGSDMLEYVLEFGVGPFQGNVLTARRLLERINAPVDILDSHSLTDARALQFEFDELMLSS